MRTFEKIALTIFTLSIFLFVGASNTNAAVECSFDRDLEIGVDGEDVRCLQKYLNDAGFTVAQTGVGSPGNETSLYRTLTQEAVIEWQLENDVRPASGYFGPLSKAKYSDLVTGNVQNAFENSNGNSNAVSNNPNVNSDDGELDSDGVLSLLDSLGVTTGSGNSNSSSNDKDEDIEELILDAINMIDDAEDEIEDAKDAGQNVDDAEDEVNDAKEDLFDAIRFYFKGDLAEALDYADDAHSNAEDAFEKAGGETEEDEAK